MKSLCYLGSLIVDGDYMIERETTLSNHIGDFLTKHFRASNIPENIDGNNKLRWELIARFVEGMERINLSPNMRSLRLKSHLAYYNFGYNNKYLQDLRQEINIFEKTFRSSNDWCWMKAWVTTLDTKSKEQCIPYHLSQKGFELYDKLTDKIPKSSFILSPLISISHAHVGYLATLIHASKLCHQRTNLYIYPELSTNIDHLLEAQRKADLCINDLNSAILSDSILRKIATESDRYSLGRAHQILTRSNLESPYSIYRSKSITTKTLNYEKKITIVRSKATIGIHCRDNLYKNQPHLEYRNSSIEFIIESIDNVFENASIIRYGKGGKMIKQYQKKSKVVIDSNETLVHEPSLLSKLDLFIGTSSGCGMFTSTLYNIPTLLLNVTIINFIELIDKNCMVSLKIFECKKIERNSFYKQFKKIDFIRLLTGDWEETKIPFREMNVNEITSVLIKACTGMTECKRFDDVDPLFSEVLGNGSRLKISDVTYDNLKKVLSYMRG